MRKIRKIEGLELLEKFGFKYLCFENQYFKDISETYYSRGCDLKTKCHNPCKYALTHFDQTQVLSNRCSKVLKCEALNDDQLVFEQSFLGFTIEKSTGTLTIEEKTFEIIIDMKKRKVINNDGAIKSPFRDDCMIISMDAQILRSLARWAAEKLPNHKESARELHLAVDLLTSSSTTEGLVRAACKRKLTPKRIRIFDTHERGGSKWSLYKEVLALWKKKSFKDMFIIKFFNTNYYKAYKQGVSVWSVHNQSYDKNVAKTIPKDKLEMVDYILENAHEIKDSCFKDEDLYSALFESKLEDFQQMIWLNLDFNIRLKFSDFKSLLGKEEFNHELVFFDAFEGFLSQYGTDKFALEAFKEHWLKNGTRIDNSFNFRSYAQAAAKDSILGKLKPRYLEEGKVKERDAEKADILIELIDEDALFGLEMISNNRAISKALDKEIQSKLYK